MKYTVDRKKGRMHAVQWTGENTDEVVEFLQKNVFRAYKSDSLHVRETIKGDHNLLDIHKNDWIIKERDNMFVLSHAQFCDQFIIMSEIRE